MELIFVALGVDLGTLEGASRISGAVLLSDLRELTASSTGTVVASVRTGD